MKNFLRHLLFVLYNLSILFYTFYGVAKSIDEYFCLERRADNPDFNDRLTTSSINLTGIGVYDKHSVLLSVNQKVILLSNDDGPTLSMYTDEEDLGPTEASYFKNYQVFPAGFTTEYKVDSSYFSLECRPVASTGVFSGDIIKNGTISYFQRVNSAFQKTGYFADYSSEDFFASLPDWANSTTDLECGLKKAPETCDIRVETTNNFFVCYAAIAITITIFHILTLSSAKRYLFLRIYKVIYSRLRMVEAEPMFCNPISGNPVRLKAGDHVYVLTDSIELDNTSRNRLSHMKDKDGDYFFNSSGVLLIKTKNERLAIDCDNVQRHIIERYFFDVYMDDKSCACDNELNHYLKTFDVLMHVANGGGMCKVMAATDRYVLDVDEFELNELMNSYNFGKKKLSVLLEHNKRFFGGVYNMPALISCLRKKTWSSDNPKDVRNTQWKYYTSDFKKLSREVLDRPAHCQVDLKSTAALTSTLAMDPNDIKVVSGVNNVIVVKNVKIDPKEVITKASVNSLLLLNKPNLMSFEVPNNCQHQESYEQAIKFTHQANALFKDSIDASPTVDEVVVESAQSKKKKTYSDICKEANRRLEAMASLMENNSSVITGAEKVMTNKARNRIQRIEKDVIKKPEKTAEKLREIEKLKGSPDSYEAAIGHLVVKRYFYRREVSNLCLRYAICVKKYDDLLKSLEDYEASLDEGKPEVVHTVSVSEILGRNVKKKPKVKRGRKSAVAKHRGWRLKDAISTPNLDLCLSYVQKSLDKSGLTCLKDLGCPEHVRPRAFHTIKHTVARLVADKNDKTRPCMSARIATVASAISKMAINLHGSKTPFSDLGFNPILDLMIC